MTPSASKPDPRRKKVKRRKPAKQERSNDQVSGERQSAATVIAALPDVDLPELFRYWAGKRRVKAPEAVRVDLHFTGRNYRVLGGALLMILVGFFLLWRGSITVAPVLLVLGYCVLVPYGLAAGQGRPAATATSSGE